LTEVNELKKSINKEMTDIMLGMKREEMTYLEQVRETSNGMLNVEYNFGIPEGVLTLAPPKLAMPEPEFQTEVAMPEPVVEAEVQEEEPTPESRDAEIPERQNEKVINNNIFPNLLEKKSIVSGAYSIVDNNISRIMDENQNFTNSRDADANNWDIMKTQAKNLGQTIKEKTETVSRSFLGGIMEAANSLKSMMHPAGTAPAREPEEKFTRFQLWFRKLILTGAEGVSDEMLTKFEADLTDHELMRREVPIFPFDKLAYRGFPSETFSIKNHASRMLPHSIHSRGDLPKSLRGHPRLPQFNSVHPRSRRFPLHPLDRFRDQ
jgi:hypothetical protein